MSGAAAAAVGGFDRFSPSLSALVPCCAWALLGLVDWRGRNSESKWCSWARASQSPRALIEVGSAGVVKARDGLCGRVSLLGSDACRPSGLVCVSFSSLPLLSSRTFAWPRQRESGVSKTGIKAASHCRFPTTRKVGLVDVKDTMNLFRERGHGFVFHSILRRFLSNEPSRL